jgi:hypothetical protein
MDVDENLDKNAKEVVDSEENEINDYVEDGKKSDDDEESE